MQEKQFFEQKNFALKRLNEALKKGEVDKAILPIIRYVNSLEDFYTTSTCAGRIVLLQDLGSKKEDFHVERWHRKIKFSELKKSLEKLPDKGATRLIQESGILHMVARNSENGTLLLKIALASGFKHSGFQVFKEPRFLVEICSSERIDVPIALNGNLIVDEKYLKYLVKLANEKFLKSQKKLKRLEKELKENVK